MNHNESVEYIRWIKEDTDGVLHKKYNLIRDIQRSHYGKSASYQSVIKDCYTILKPLPKGLPFSSVMLTFKLQ